MKSQLEAALGRDVPRETEDRLREYLALVVAENERQNLISKSTVDVFWERHIVDSAQLIRFAPAGAKSWVDLGSGAGLPGIVIAILGGFEVTLVEPRRLRADFLDQVVETLGLAGKVVATKAESMTGRFDIISARAVANLSRVLEISRHLSTGNTSWILPKGKSAQSELAEARRAWQAEFHVERSLTDRESSIIVARNVRPIRR